MTMPHDVKSVAVRLMRDLNTPRSLTVKLLVENGEWDQLTQLDIDPKHYHDTISGAKKFAHDFQATEFLRKCSDLEIAGVDRERNAREGFWASECANFQTNRRLEPWLSGYPSEIGPSRAHHLWKFIQKMRKDIKRVLGPVPDSLPLFRFGPGTVVGANKLGRPPTPADKLSMEKLRITTAVHDIFFHGMPWGWESAWRESSAVLEYVRAEQFSVVRKNARTDRTIGIQCIGNLAVQLAIGSYLKQRLLYSIARLDLKHGQAAHAELARAASLSNEDATIDHKNASNSSARGFIKLVFPEDWFELLDDSRMHYTVDKVGRVTRLEMFSAMGNGFTFEVETLLFWAIARAVGVENPHVYGDDVIIPAKNASDYIAAARYFGFETNRRKTYTEGPFRESCGGNYFLGFELQPFRLEEFPANASDWISFNNGLYRAASGLARGTTVFARRLCVSAVPYPARLCRGPVALGDLVLHGLKPHIALVDTESFAVPAKQVCPVTDPDFVVTDPTVQDELRGVFTPRVKIHDKRRNASLVLGWRGITYYRVWQPINHKLPFERWGGSALQTAMALLGLSSSGVGYRDNVTGWKLAWHPYS